MKRFVLFLLMCGVSYGQAPPSVGAYTSSDGLLWSPWTSAAAFGAIGYIPPAMAMYCQASVGAAWTPCAPSGGGGSGFPIVLGATSLAASSTTTAVTGLSVNGVSLTTAGSSSNFLNQAGGYTAPGGGLSTLPHNVLTSDSGTCTLNVWDASQALPSGGTPYYPTQLGTLLGCSTVNNNSLGGTSIADMYNGAALYNFASTVPTNGVDNILGFGDNDLSNMSGIGTTAQITWYQEQVENWGWWLSTPDAKKIYANNAGVSITGTWTTGSNPSASKQTTGTGTISASGDCSLCGISILKTVSSTATYTISIDGVAQTNPLTSTTTYTSGEGAYTSATGATADWSMYSYQVPRGYHTVLLTWVSGTVNVAGFEFMSQNSAVTSGPQVIKVLAERWGHSATSPAYSPNHTDTIVATLQGYEQAVINKLAANGANIMAVDVNASGQGNGYEPNILAQTIGDYVHPNGSVGATLLAGSIFSQINSATAVGDRGKDLSSPFQSLTTVGTSGAATLVSGVLNIPNYAGSGYPQVTSEIVGSAGASAAGLKILGNANGLLPTYVSSIVGQQAAFTNNVHFDGANWLYDVIGGAAGFRLPGAAAAPGVFQLDTCPIGAAGGTAAMDTTCVAQWSIYNGSGNQTWFNSQAVNPTFPTYAALVLNPSANWWVDFSGNETANSVTVGGLPVRGSISNAITSATGGSGTGTVTCASAACTNLRGSYTVAGGTFATGTLLALVWPTTTTAYVCSATVLNNATGASIGYHSVATATGMNITSLTAVTGLSVDIDYSCQP